MRIVNKNFATPSAALASLAPKSLPIAHAIKDASRSIFDGYEQYVKPIQKLLVFQNILKIVNVPLAIAEIIKNRTIIYETNRDKKIDQGLEICDHIKVIAETTGAFVFALDTFNAISFPVEAAAKPFTAVISFLSLASMNTQARTCMKAWKYKRALNAASDFEEMVALTKQRQTEDPKFISSTFNTTEEKLMHAFSKIQGKEKMEKAAKSLKDRVRNHFISSSVALAASTISLIGTIVLLVVSSTVFGWVMVGIGAAVNIEQFLHRKFTEYQFSKTVDLERTSWEWLTC